MIYDKNNPNESDFKAINSLIESVKLGYMLRSIVFKFHKVAVGNNFLDCTICFIYLEGGHTQAYVSGSDSRAMSAKPTNYSLKRVKAFMKQAEIIEAFTF